MSSDHFHQYDSFFESLVFQFEGLKNYIDNAEELVNAQQKELARDRESAFRDPDPEVDIDQLQEYYAWRSEQIEYFLPLYIYNSCLVSLCSFMEFGLVHICKYHALFLRSKLQLTDIKGQGTLERCETYLSKVAGIQVQADHWQRARTINRLRNIIVHDLACPDPSATRM